MLDARKHKLLEELVAGASQDELTWLNGYLSALVNKTNNITPVPEAGSVPQKITLLYGTETGNAKRVATDLAARARKRNITVKLAGLDQYRLTDITREEKLFVVISTQGDGDPPEAARKFYDHIHKNGFRLDHVRFSVLALGDTSYPMFCKTGEDVDAQLEKLGATRIVPIRKCDVDYEPDADAWFTEVLRQLEQQPAVWQEPLKTGVGTVVKSNKIVYTGEVVASINLHDTGSPKETWHIELLADNVDYLPGDSIGVVPGNDPALVEQVLLLVGADASKLIAYKDQEYTLRDLLQKKLSIIYLHERTVKKYAAIVEQDIPEMKMDLLNLLQLYPVKNVQQFEEAIQVLSLQSPRIYTVASSPSAHPGEIHLTVEKDAFLIDGATRSGLCSTYLGALNTGARFDFFVQKNKRFRLPATDKDIVMIGPGTGIAAFRSFLSERDASGATGKNWLFFGEDHFVSDFLYQTEIQSWYETGVLNKVSLAFSKDRDGMPVHEKILQEGAELFAWLESGAHLYLCGQKHPMSTQVEEALLAVFETHGRKSAAEAKEYFSKLKTDGRYAKDVY